MNYPKNLKYPYSEFVKLVDVVKQLAPYFEIENINPNQLHYLAFQQTSLGQPHNKIYFTGQVLKRFHSMNEIEIKNYQPIVNVNFELELYPNDCNDNHIETATKRAIKTVLMDLKNKTS